MAIHQRATAPGSDVVDRSFMPVGHRSVLEGEPKELMDWAAGVGPGTTEVIKHHLCDRSDPTNGFRPYEQGLHYKLALDRGLFPSIRSMAAAIGVDASQAAKVIKIAELPEEVMAAFGSPHVVQVNWAHALHRVLTRDRDGAIRRSKDIASGNPSKPSASSTFAAITRDASVEPFHAPTVEIRDSAGQRVAWIRQEKGNYQIVLRAQGIALNSLEEAVKRLIPV
jgi:hypothetical protein